MAISFTCPFCTEAYNNLKEELIGKRVTCRNVNCRKVFVVKPNEPVVAAAPVVSTSPLPGATTDPAAPPAKAPVRQPIRPAPIPKPTASAPPPVDAEALALAAFAEEAKKPEVEQTKISVTCTFCDHKFDVGREMEGRNTPCPECRKLIKVPLLKKEEAVDWRKQDNRDHLKKTEPALEGATEKKAVSAEALIQAGAVPKIEYEPLPLATKVKRALFVLTLLGLIGLGVTYLMKSRNAKTDDRNVTDAIKAIEEGEESKGRTDLQAAIFRLAAEERLRTVRTKADLDEAVRFLNTARDRVLKGGDNAFERQAELVEIALTYCSLGGTAEELSNNIRLKWDDVQKHIRQTLEKIGDDELRDQGVIRVARKLAEYHEGWRALDVAKQIFPANRLPEIAGRIGLELLKLGQKDLASEFLRKKVGPMVDSASAQGAGSLIALRIALGTPDEPAPLNDIKTIPRIGAGGISEDLRLGWSQGYAFSGDLKMAGDIAARPGNAEVKVRCFLTATEKALTDNARDAAVPLIEAAGDLVIREGKSATIPVWLKVRVVHLLARCGRSDGATRIVDTLDKELQTWARVELLRGRLEASTETAQEDWLPPVPEGTKPRLAHAVARERFARHQAASGLSTPADTLSPTLKPFAQLGSLLGSANRGNAP